MSKGRHSGMGGKARPERLRRSALDRLVRYYLCLREPNDAKESPYVLSARIAACVDVDETQVRRDLAAIGVRGRPHVGFRRDEVTAAIRAVLGLEGTYRAVIVGAGRMGGAIAEYADLRTYGLSIAALFDNDPAKIGRPLGGRRVKDVAELETAVRALGAEIAILTCPAAVAQGLADRLVRAGVRAIWNFAPTAISVPQGVAVRNEYISVGLAELTHYLSHAPRAGSTDLAAGGKRTGSDTK